GIGVQSAVNVTCRMFFLRRLFNGFDILRHAARASAPVVPPTVAVLVLRAFEPAHRQLLLVAAEIAIYCVLYAAVTWLLERDLLKEMVSYLLGARRSREDPLTTRDAVAVGSTGGPR
ncbi:MAG TPA: hypothetical protein VFA70_03855, partial [Dehalococcoidia bacterium]|nr:hypothetical protein [Dehalococcoidia bacterium]